MRRPLITLLALALCLSMQCAHTLPISLAKHTYLSPSIGAYLPDSSRSLPKSLSLSLTLGYQISPYFAMQARATWLNHGHRTTLYHLESVSSLLQGEDLSFFFLAGAGQMRFDQNPYFFDLGLGTKYYLAPRISLEFTVRGYKPFNASKIDTSFGPSITWYFGGGSDRLVFDRNESQRVRLPFSTQVTQTHTNYYSQLMTQLKDIRPCHQQQVNTVSLCKKLTQHTLTLYFTEHTTNDSETTIATTPTLIRFMQLYRTLHAKKLAIYAQPAHHFPATHLSTQYYAEQFKQVLVNHYGLPATRVSINQSSAFTTQRAMAEKAQGAKRALIGAQFSIHLPAHIS